MLLQICTCVVLPCQLVWWNCFTSQQQHMGSWSNWCGRCAVAAPWAQPLSGSSTLRRHRTLSKSTTTLLWMANQCELNLTTPRRFWPVGLGTFVYELPPQRTWCEFAVSLCCHNSFITFSVDLWQASYLFVVNSFFISQRSVMFAELVVEVALDASGCRDHVSFRTQLRRHR